MTKSSICHLLLGYYPQPGGAEIQAQRLASYQREQGLQVCVVARRRLVDPIERAWPAYEEIDGIPVYRVPVWGKGHLAALTYFLFGLWQLFRLRHRYQVIHAHMLSAPALLGGLAGRLLGKKVVAKASGGGFQVRSNISDLQHSSLRRGVLCHTLDRFLSINRQIAADLTQLGFPPEKITYLPNGIDVNAFALSSESPERYRQRLNLPQKGTTLVYTGRLRPVKNVPVLLKSLFLLKDQFSSLYMLIVGDGAERPKLEAMVDELTLRNRVFFIGNVSDVRPYLHAADVFVLPSLKEGLSNSMLEAMAVGLPVVATAVGGAPDLIEDGVNGILLSANPTLAEITEALASLLKEPDRAREMGRRARQTVVECCSFEVVGERIISLYQELLEA